LASDAFSNGTLLGTWHLFANFGEVAMVACEIYRQRAAECERMAQKRPAERDQLIEIAKTWRFLAQAAESLSEITEAKTIH
jgi:hypothetical protein